MRPSYVKMMKGVPLTMSDALQDEFLAKFSELVSTAYSALEEYLDFM